MDWMLVYNGRSSQGPYAAGLVVERISWRNSITDSGHEHVGDPCIVCGLSEVFGELREASTRTRREIVSTASLRLAISKNSPRGDSFQKVCKANVV